MPLSLQETAARHKIAKNIFLPHFKNPQSKQKIQENRLVILRRNVGTQNFAFLRDEYSEYKNKFGPQSKNFLYI